MSAYTPGPWTLDGEPLSQSCHVFAKGLDGHQFILANCKARLTFITSSNLETDQANARLIRAAPDLLDALQEAVDGWEEGSQYKGEFLREKHGDAEGIAKVRALISMVLGQ